MTAPTVTIRPPDTPAVTPRRPSLGLRVHTPNQAVDPFDVDGVRNVLAIGDSNTEQIAANHLEDRWTNLLEESLRTALSVTGGDGYVTRDLTGYLVAGEDTTISGVQNVDWIRSSASGFGYKAVRLVTSSGFETWPAMTCDWVRVYFSAILGAGTLTVKADGVTIGTIDCGSVTASSQDHWVDFPLGSSAERVISVHLDAVGTLGFPYPTVCGVHFFDGDRPAGAYLDIDGTTGAHSATPDAAAFDLTGDVHTFRAKLYVADPTQAGEQYAAARGDSLANKRNYLAVIDVDGRPKLYWSTNGTAYSSAVSTGDPLDPGLYWIEWELTRDNGGGSREVTFRVSTDADDLAQNDHSAVANWVAHGSTVTGATVGTLFATDVALRVGVAATGLSFLGQFTGRVYAVAVLDDGTEVAAPVFAANSNPRFRDAAGRVWTATGGATHEIDTDGSSGLNVINCGHTGFRIRDFANGTDYASGATAQATSDLSGWLLRQPVHCVVLTMSGTNDSDNDDDPLEFAIMRQAVIDEIRSVSATVPIIHVIMPTPTESDLYPYSRYADAARDQARSDGASVLVDLVEEWPQPGTPEGDASLLYIDGVPHLSASVGHPTLAERVEEAMGALTLYDPGRVTVDTTDPARPRVGFRHFDADFAVTDGAGAEGFALLTEGGDYLITEGGDNLLLEAA